MKPRKRSIVGMLAAAAFAATIIVGGGPAAADERDFSATSLQPSDTVTGAAVKDGRRPEYQPGETVTVIVKLDEESVASYDGGIAGLPGTSTKATGKKKLDLDSKAAKDYRAYLKQKHDKFKADLKKNSPAAQVLYDFDVVVGGVVVRLPASDAASLRAIAGVQALYADELLQPTTEVSPQFIGAPTVWSALGGQDDAGEGVIVGVLDTGIWPEHASYSDPDPGGEPYAAPPPPLSGTRQCEFSGGANPGPAFTCNNKLIAADRFMATYDVVIGLLPAEFTTARDDNGHGTHTSSTAAGNGGVAASIYGIDRGIVSGIAPRAHVAMYKVCGDQGCFQSDSAAAIQKAIQDGVDAINFSISGGTNPYADAVELAFLDAYNAGVFVAASAGNSGPTADTVSHRGPWVTTVGASTSDRHFLSTLTLSASNADTATFTGATVTAGIGPTPVVNAAAAPFNDPLCLSSAPDGAYTGKVVLCARGTIGRVLKSFNVAQRGAVGLILYNTAPQGLNTDNHFVPSIHLDTPDNVALLAFFNSHTGVQATFTAGTATAVQGDVMAPFSSRGGSGQSIGVSKPDVTAPGVQILAGNSPAGATPLSGVSGQLFQSIQGTSMSSPHVAGAGALLAALHPDWTPGQIKSALMTTGLGSVINADGSDTTPFDDGSGRIDLNEAGNPGITFDVSGADYVAHQGDLWNTNYPSVYLPVASGAITIQRTAHSLLADATGWNFSVDSPADLKITVPGAINIPGDGDTTFDITIDAKDVPIGQVRHATINLKHGGFDAHVPVTIVRKQAAVSLNKACLPATFQKGTNTSCSITMVNTTLTDSVVSLTDKLPKELKLDAGSVVGGTGAGNTVSFAGTLQGGDPSDPSLGPGSSPAGGYLPLSLFGVTPVAGVTDDSLTNFNVPAFLYGGEVYSRVGFSSNGYAVIGGGTGADNQFVNQNLPNPTRPNNVLAPFWTDLNPPAGGALRIATLTDGLDTWIVLDWEAVREFSLPRTASFQIWIGINGDANPAEDISFAYGTIQGNGDGGFLTVGVENRFGNRGNNVYFNGAGTLPAIGTQLRVGGTPFTPGETKVVSFNAKGDKVGTWTNYAELVSDLVQGTIIAAFSGEVTK